MLAKRLFPLLAVLTLGGCELLPGASSGPLLPDARSPIADVPMPAGFSMGDDSTSQQVKSYRVVNHHYTGYDGMFAVVGFYKEQLPLKAWTFVDQNQPAGDMVVMHWKKSGEDCWVSVSRRTLDTSVRITIEPQKRATAAASSAAGL